MSDFAHLYKDYAGRDANELLLALLHDLSSPTRTITGAVELLRDHTTVMSPQERDQILELIALCSANIATVIDAVAQSRHVRSLPRSDLSDYSE